MMFGGHITNIEMIKIVAMRLGSLNNKVVFLGGATTDLFITDPAAPKTRVSRDVDIIIEITSRTDYYKLEADLRKRGFTQGGNEDNEPLCRWRIDEIIVDVMPTDSTILGFSNTWYSPAIEWATLHEIDNTIQIKLVTAPYFLATKTEAFYGRGEEDYLASRDMEDIVALIDGRKEIVAEIAHAPEDLRTYLSKTFQKFLHNEAFLESLPGHLPSDSASQARYSLIVERLKQIADAA
jgi:predicted nucleotidyltransferase